MKILVVCQHYWPEPYPLVDTCEELAKRWQPEQNTWSAPDLWQI